MLAVNCLAPAGLPMNNYIVIFTRFNFFPLPRVMMHEAYKSSLRVVLIALLFLLVSCADRHPDCDQLAMDLSVGNAGCMVLRGTSLLMVQQQLGSAWAMPGGTAESGERAVCTALRETYEETGFHVKAIEKIARFPNGFHLYLCTPLDMNSSGVVDNLEIRQAAWFDAEARQALKWRFEEQKNTIEQLIQDQLNSNAQ